MLLRWYDTRILPVWLQLLTAEQKAVFTAAIEEWHYFDRFGDLQPLPLPGPLAAVWLRYRHYGSMTHSTPSS